MIMRILGVLTFIAISQTGYAESQNNSLASVCGDMKKLIVTESQKLQKCVLANCAIETYGKLGTIIPLYTKSCGVLDVETLKVVTDNVSNN